MKKEEGKEGEETYTEGQKIQIQFILPNPGGAYLKCSDSVPFVGTLVSVVIGAKMVRQAVLRGSSLC